MATSQAQHIVDCARRIAKKRMSGPDVPPPPPKRKHAKRHATGFRLSLEKKAKNKKAKEAQKEFRKRQRKTSEIMRRYFAGEIDDLSALSKTI